MNFAIKIVQAILIGCGTLKVWSLVSGFFFLSLLISPPSNCGGGMRTERDFSSEDIFYQSGY